MKLGPILAAVDDAVIGDGRHQQDERSQHQHERPNHQELRMAWKPVVTWLKYGAVQHTYDDLRPQNERAALIQCVLQLLAGFVQIRLAQIRCRSR